MKVLLSLIFYIGTWAGQVWLGSDEVVTLTETIILAMVCHLYADKLIND